MRRPLFRRMMVGAVGSISWLFARIMRMDIHGVERLHALTLKPRSRGLLTICNHTSTVDDPFIWGALLPLRIHLFKNHLCRWILGAEDVVFKVAALRPAFHYGQVISVSRGAGLWQPGINRAVELLKQKEWVHIFPEAYVNQSGLMRPLRWGTARLIMEGGCPIVLPIWHLGMEHMMPEGTLQIPRPFTKVRVLIGEPIDFSELLHHHATIGSSHEATRGHIMQVLTSTMLALQKRAIHIEPTWTTPPPVPPVPREHPVETGVRPVL